MTEKYGLTGKQSKLLAALKGYIDDNSMSPTYAELAEILGKSPKAIHQMVAQLEERGYIRSLPGRARSIIMVEDPPDDYDDSMDGDHASALASAGWGVDEDYR